MNPPLRSREDRDALLAGRPTYSGLRGHRPRAASSERENAEFDQAPFGYYWVETARGYVSPFSYARRKFQCGGSSSCFNEPSTRDGLAHRGTLRWLAC